MRSPLDEFDLTAAQFAQAVKSVDDPKAPVSLPAGEPPAYFAVAVHAADMLVHGWDIAVSTGRDPSLEPDLCAAALAVLERYPDSLWGPGRFFAERLDARSTSPQDRLLALSGRRVG